MKLTAQQERMIGKRVELHPGTDDWMRGDKYGAIVGFGRRVKQQCRRSGAVHYVHPIKVLMDRSERVKTFHPQYILNYV